MNWSTQSLDKLLVLSDSGTWGEEGDEFVGSPVLRSTNIQNSSLLLNNVAWRIVPDSHRKKKKLDDGDIIVTTSSGSPQHIGKCCLFKHPSDRRDYYFSNFTIRLRPNTEKLESSWLQYWLSSPQGRAVLSAMNNTTSGLRNLDKHRYLSQKLPLPPIEEQKRIAAILDKADAIRRSRQKAIRLTEELLRSTFLDMFGDPVTNPKGWEVVPMKDVISQIEAGWSAKGEERQRDDDEWGVLKISAVTSGVFKPKEHKAVDNPTFKKNPIIPQKGDLLFSRANTRELVAATCLVKSDCEKVFLPDKLWRIKTNPDVANVEYLRFLLADPRYRSLLARKATGTSGSMLNVSQAKLLSMNAPVPDISIQAKFADVLWRIYQLKERTEKSFETLNVNFHSLLQKAFRGEL